MQLRANISIPHPCGQCVDDCNDPNFLQYVVARPGMPVSKGKNWEKFYGRNQFYQMNSGDNWAQKSSAVYHVYCWFPSFAMTTSVAELLEGSPEIRRRALKLMIDLWRVLGIFYWCHYQFGSCING